MSLAQDAVAPVATTPTGLRQPGRTAAPHPFLALVVPALDEAAYIEACLASLVTQWPAASCEILVLDGGSRDATVALVERFATRHAPPRHPPIRVLRNPRRIQSAALNLAAEHADPRATILVRADAHAAYPAGFVRGCVAALLGSGATSVVVPMRNAALPQRPLQRAIAAAQSSRLGNGGAAHRTGGRSGFVAHGHHAAFDRAFFRRLGGYDESFTHNEDAELDHRALQAGGRIWMQAEAPVTYFPRTGFGALAGQYLRHGAGRARTLLKHRILPKPRQLAPVAVLGGCVAGLAALPVAPAAAAGVLVYPALCLGWALGQALRRRDPWLVAAAPALMTMHLAWACGFLGAVLRRGRA